MAAGYIRFRLDDGEDVRIPDEDLRPIYETLWELVQEPGAVSTAALVMDAWRIHPYARPVHTLSAKESAVLRKAVAHVTTARHFANPS